VRMLVMMLLATLVMITRSHACEQYPQPPLPTADITLTAGNVVNPLTVELAVTSAQKACGLMGRGPLAPSTGMLFDMRPAGAAFFWMDNTPEPLDMLFVDTEGSIIHIEANAVPFSRRMRGTRKPVAAVLELAAGSVARLGIGVGDRISLPWSR
jgi:uncharacterized membrane protein (UPF0127 family)